MSEQILKDCHKAFGLNSVILRYFNVAGASVYGNNGQRTVSATHLIKVASQAACYKRPFCAVYGTDYPTPDGTGVRDYIHVDDLAQLHVLALEYLETQSQVSAQVVNCGYGQGYSVLEVLKAMQKVSQVPFTIEYQDKRAGDACSLVADSSLARNLLQWKPSYDNIEYICQTAYEWEKKLGVKI
jgi:UDP-glucose 4-epimerase